MNNKLVVITNNNVTMERILSYTNQTKQPKKRTGTKTFGGSQEFVR